MSIWKFASYSRANRSTKVHQLYYSTVHRVHRLRQLSEALSISADALYIYTNDQFGPIHVQHPCKTGVFITVVVQ